MLDKAFDALKEYDWGSDMGPLAPIEDAVAASYGKPEDRKNLEARLVTVLSGPLTRDAQDYVCRKLAVVGSEDCVENLKPLLLNKGNSHMARFVLERMPSPAAAKALREAVMQAPDELKVGLINSIGARRDTDAITLLDGLLGDGNAQVARAAMLALGTIGTAAAADLLRKVWKSSGDNMTYAVDAMMHCAETLLANNHRQDAHAIYQQFAAESNPRYVRLAATRGLLACANS